MAPLPKRFGYQLPLEALGGVCVRVSIEFPDKLEYRAAYNGAINMLGKWFQWDHTQADYQDIPELNVEVAQLWSEVLAAATWEECVEFCARIIACLAEDADVRQAFRDFIISDPAINQHITDIAQNQVLSLTNREKNILKPDECNPDFLFNQCSVLVQLCHDLSEDIFEAIEVGTNQLERADIFVGAFPAAGFNDTAATVFRVADQLAEELQEDYMGAYDEELYDQIRCKIFCACKDDCLLSLDKTIGIYKDLIAEELPDDPMEAFLFVLQYIVTGDFPTDAPVYIMHLLVLTAIRVGTEVLGIDFGKLANRILAAGDEGDNDWEILCEDCTTPPVDDCQDLTASEGNWFAADASGGANASFGIYISGEGAAPNQTNQQFFWVREVGPTETITGVTLTFNEAVTGVYLYSLDSGGFCYYTGSAVSTVTFDTTTDPDFFPKDLDTNRLALTFPSNIAPNMSTRLTEVCVIPETP